MGSPKKRIADDARSKIAITHYAIGDLKPYLKNARTHSPQQVDAIARSMLEWGWTNPVLLDGRKGIVAGHGRILAAQKLWADGKSIKRCVKGMVPSIDLYGLTVARKRAYIIADNQLALAADWDGDILAEELEALRAADFGDELSKLLGRPEGPDPDYAPPVAETPISVAGDIWTMGKHRLSCGDCTISADVEALFAGTKPHLMVTDPPYGIDYDPSHWQHESCWYAVRDGSTGHWVGDRSQTTLWSIESTNQDAKTVHATQKPVECMRRPMENNSSIGQAVYYPFVGSGTSVIAAEQIGRHCYAMELDPLYMDVAVRRWQTFTGKAAVHGQTGKTFAEVEAERCRKRKPRKAA